MNKALLKKVAWALVIITLVATFLVGYNSHLVLIYEVIGLSLVFIAFLIKKMSGADIKLNIPLILGLSVFTLVVMSYIGMAQEYEFKSDPLGEMTIYENSIDNLWYKGEDMGSSWTHYTSVLNGAFLTTRVPAMLAPLVDIDHVVFYRFYIVLIIALAAAAVSVIIYKISGSLVLTIFTIGFWLQQFYYWHAVEYTRIIAGIAVYIVIVGLVVLYRKQSHLIRLMAAAFLMSITYYATAILGTIMMAVTIPFSGKATKPALFAFLSLGLVYITVIGLLIFMTGDFSTSIANGASSPLKYTQQLAISGVQAIGQPNYFLNHEGYTAYLLRISKPAILNFDYWSVWWLNWIMFAGTFLLSTAGLIYYRDWLSKIAVFHFLLCILALLTPTLTVAWGFGRFWFIGAPLMFLSGSRILTEGSHAND